MQVFLTARKFHYNDIDPELEDKLNKIYSGVVALHQHAWTPTLVGTNTVDDIDVDQQSHDYVDDFLRVVDDVGDRNVPTPSMSQGLNIRKRRRGGSQFFKEGTTYLVSSYSSIVASSNKPTRAESLTNAVQLLESMLKILDDRKIYLYATTVLEDNSKRILFMTISADPRANYVRFHVNN